MSATTPPEIDGLVFVEHLGTGGYSDVYLYERRAPRMKIAVKVLKEGRLAESQLAQFAAEAETMAELADHPYIVQVFSTDTTEGGRPFLVMKYYPPPNLGARAAQERFSVADVLRTGVKIGGAVETAHRAGILHRDIKPANILVSQYGEPGLTDFGIAGRAADTAEDDDLGVSIPWSPPEVLSGESNGSVQADVYALAATLWHLLVGRSPFEVAGGDNAPRALMSRILRSAPPATGRADVPASLERLLQQAMAKKASNRPRSALEFARSLQGIEQELRFARTEIVTGEFGGGSAAVHTGPWDARHSAPPQRMQPDRPATPDAGPDATRLRAPTRVTAQPGQPNRFAPPAVTPARSAEPPTTARPIRPQQPAGAPTTRGHGLSRSSAGSDAPPATVLRPTRPQTPGHSPSTAGATDAAETEAAPSKKGVKARWVVIVASVALIAAVVVGVVLSSRGGKPGDRAGDHGYSNAPQPGAGFDPPQQPSVTASRSGDKVSFSWTYDNPQQGDYFLWGTTDGTAQHRASTRSVSVPAPHSGKVCVTVQAVRGNGQSSLPSAPVCG
jgi:serine/threonine protein kinase